MSKTCVYIKTTTRETIPDIVPFDASNEAEEWCPFPKSTAKSVGVATARSRSRPLLDFSSSMDGFAAIVAYAEGDGGQGDKKIPQGEDSFASCSDGRL